MVLRGTILSFVDKTDCETNRRLHVARSLLHEILLFRVAKQGEKRIRIATNEKCCCWSVSLAADFISIKV